MLKLKPKILGVLTLTLAAFAGQWNVANAQVFNLAAGPAIDTQSVTSGWSAGANATYMTRLNPNNVPIILRGSSTLVSANQLDFDFNLGYEAFIARSFDDGGKIEFKLSALDNASATSSSTFLGTDSLATSPASTIFIPGSLTTTLNSGFISGEMNVYIPLGLSTDWSVGLRWIEYDETMTLASVFTHTTNVDNHLYGIQTGLDTLLTSNDLYELSIFGKGGAYGNNADQVTTLSAPARISQTFDTELAAVVEAGFKGKLKITDNIAIDFGYTGLYLGGIALAPDQLNTHSSVLGGLTSTRLDMGDTFYHGGFAGITINR